MASEKQEQEWRKLAMESLRQKDYETLGKVLINLLKLKMFDGVGEVVEIRAILSLLMIPLVHMKLHDLACKTYQVLLDETWIQSTLKELKEGPSKEQEIANMLGPIAIQLDINAFLDNI